MVLGGWFRGAASDVEPLTSEEDEITQLKHTLESAEPIMNDDPALSEELLSSRNDAFHKQALGIVTFLRATIGFEKDVMAEAGVRLNEAENAADEGLRNFRSHPELFHSEIYPDGAVYNVGVAQARNLSAVVSVLNENITEAIKGFLKLRKAYQIMDAIVKAEEAYLKEKGYTPVNIKLPAEGKISLPASALGSKATSVKEAPESADANADSDDDDDDDEFHDADDDRETHSNAGDYPEKSANGSAVLVEEERFYPPVTDPSLSVNDDRHKYISHPIDIYTHSAAAINFGITLLLLSLMPPVFSKLLSLVGFRGDRERGLSMLWRVTKVGNINSTIAALVLLAYYNILMSFLDILPDSAYPRERCNQLLEDMLKRYGNSSFWAVQEARTEAAEGRLERAVELLEKMEKKKTQMKQVEGMQWFEKALCCQALHRYDKSAEAWLNVIEFNTWSHGLYYYIAGTCYLEKYRMEGDKDAADKAEELWAKVPEHAGKKKLIGRGLPFDEFIIRKLNKWNARAKERGCRLADAAGVSPCQEMSFFWNCYGRMKPEDLEKSLKNLNWSEDPKTNPHWEEEGLDERAVLALLKASILRCMKKTTEARELLETEITGHAWSEFRGGYKDDWTAPIARYELAVGYWIESGVASGDGVGSKERDLLLKAKAKLDEVANWDHYDLDARFGLKITTGRNTLNRYLNIQ